MNTVEEGLHTNPEIERKFKKIVRKAYEEEKNTKIMAEVEIWTRTEKKGKPLREKNTIDLMVVPEKKENSEEPIVIIEIKTSEGLLKYNEMRKGINDIKHLQRKLGKEKVLPVVVVNSDRKKKGKIVTKDYGLVNGVLLIGKTN
ncbi:MAG: hypothetical protein K9W42_07930 [Candidatus Heimdallarchaeota archaeon]|nr:hypothetical protein [Candidatus Heimdallarchaeota archaeon]